MYITDARKGDTIIERSSSGKIVSTVIISQIEPCTIDKGNFKTHINGKLCYENCVHIELKYRSRELALTAEDLPFSWKEEDSAITGDW